MPSSGIPPTPGTDQELIAGWRDRLERGEPWSEIEREVLTQTHGSVEKLVVLIATAWLVADAESPS